jgi:hypothetical protein
MLAGSSGGVAVLSTLMACGYNVVFLLLLNLSLLYSISLYKDNVSGFWPPRQVLCFNEPLNGTEF